MSSKNELLMLKGMISDLSAEEQAKIRAIKEQVNKVITENGDEGALAVALIMLEYAVETENAN